MGKDMGVLGGLRAPNTPIFPRSGDSYFAGALYLLVKILADGGFVLY